MTDKELLALEKFIAEQQKEAVKACYLRSFAPNKLEPKPWWTWIKLQKTLWYRGYKERFAIR